MKQLIAAAALLAGVGMAASAGAQTTVSGSTQACFGIGCTNYASSATYNIDGSGTSIVFTGTNFSGMTNSVTNAFTVGDFGSLILNGLTGATANTSFSTPFSLLFTLTAPPGATNPTLVETVSGFVGSGSRDITYTGSLTPFTFTGGVGTLSVDGGQIGVSATDISGRITALTTAVPEAATWAMMILGMGAIGFAMRRQKVSAQVNFG